jgi:membrane fusion protein, multidrug efflux system
MIMFERNYQKIASNHPWAMVKIAAALLFLMGPGAVFAQETLLKSPAMEDASAKGRTVYPAIFEAKSKAVLSAERAGLLTKWEYDVGSPVKKGSVLAVVDTAELALRKKRQQQALNHLDVQVKDLTNLKQRGLATNEDVAKARMERDVTRTDLEMVERLINQSYIRAPFGCVVVRRHVQPHEWVMDGQPVVDVVNLDDIRAVANIPAYLAVTLSPGTAHSFHVHDLGAEVVGKVFAVAPEVDERSNTAQVIWTLEKGENKLLPGMKGEVRIDQ